MQTTTQEAMRSIEETHEEVETRPPEAVELQRDPFDRRSSSPRKAALMEGAARHHEQRTAAGNRSGRGTKPRSPPVDGWMPPVRPRRGKTSAASRRGPP